MNFFLWGAATSSHQIEGFNDKNDWSAWEKEGRIEGGVRSGAATDHLHRYREDLELAAALKLNSYRFSIEWSRIEPEEGVWDEPALDWYAELLDQCEKNCLIPMLTLHHFTSPIWFAEKGGFARRGAAEEFARFVRKVVQRLGARVPLWCTLNEPMVMTLGGYLGKFMPPAKYAPQDVSLVSTELLRAHVLAYDIIHREIPDRQGPWKNRALEVGLAHNMMDFMPARSWHPLEQVFSWFLDSFYNQAWLDGVLGKKQHFGLAGLVPGGVQVPEALGRRTADFIGVNYYTRADVQWRPRQASEAQVSGMPLGISFARRGEQASDLGWAVHPKGLFRILRSVGKRGLPIYVTENGIADRDDKLRGQYLGKHLEAVSRAKASGVDVRGYFHWSLLDNFEWIKGFGPRFGLYRVDYETFERKPTRSALFYQAIISRHEQRRKTDLDLESLQSVEKEWNSECPSSVS